MLFDPTERDVDPFVFPAVVVVVFDAILHNGVYDNIRWK